MAPAKSPEVKEEDRYRGDQWANFNEHGRGFMRILDSILFTKNNFQENFFKFFNVCFIINELARENIFYEGKKII